jgi:hypothetical protein
MALFKYTLLTHHLIILLLTTGNNSITTEVSYISGTISNENGALFDGKQTMESKGKQ